MSKYLLLCAAGYLMGMKHQWFCRHICWAGLWKKTRKMLRHM